MQYFVNILKEIAFTEEPLKNPAINSFINWEKFRGENVFLISRILLQFEESDPVINSSMQQPQKRFLVIYCATYLKPALLVDRLVCYFTTYFFKSIREKSKALKKHTSLTHWMSLLNECEKRKHSTKMFHEIIISKLRENRCNWFANS